MKKSVQEAANLADKLVAFSNGSLNADEQKMLDTILAVYQVAISEKAPDIFGEDQGFLSEIKAAGVKEEEGEHFITTVRTITTSSRPCVNTITTVTTVASHPWIGCEEKK